MRPNTIAKVPGTSSSANLATGVKAIKEHKQTKPTRRVGPGTLAMLLGIGVFALYSYMTKPSGPDRIYYEANRKGVMARVDRPNASSHKLPQPFKPEPEWLMARAGDLNLTGVQLASLGTIDSQWKSTKAVFDLRFQSYAKLISNRGGRTASSAQLQDSLAEYSAVSREYDRQRLEAWRRSMNHLTSVQRKRVDLLLEAIR